MSAYSDEEDAQLLQRARRDPDAFAELYRRHVHKITAFAARRCRTPDEVHDLVAAVWLEALASAERFDPERGRAVPWLLGIAANLSASAARRRSREREALERLGGQRTLDRRDRSRLERRIDAAGIRRDVRAATQNLPAGERAVFELVAFDEHTPAEAAEILGISAPAARNRLARARRKVRDSLSDDTSGHPNVSLAAEEVQP